MTRQKGFTLIELLIVVVIIGILAAIAIPKFAATKQKAYTASMKTDLRNLVTAQEAYFSSNSSYTNAVTTGAMTSSFHPSAGNVITPGTVTSTGWNATATNSFVPAANSGGTCAVYVGSSASKSGGVNADTVEGAPACN
ncbi:MAG TPA: prepilin-type N-terminal cleavage/methylation domain-containing protein [Gemmatimonadaceae bacterium]|nr:prepilin-type N-terminal cleavage/methylation domain-containing protein [Gemmatimonadaceae bacterium]